MKIILPFLFVLFLFNDATAFEIKYLQYNASLNKKIASLNITFSGDLKLDEDYFYYSLNNSGYKSFDNIQPLDSDIRGQITDLELNEGENSVSILYMGNITPTKVDTVITFIAPELNIRMIKQDSKPLEATNDIIVIDNDKEVKIDLKYIFNYQNKYDKILGNGAIEKMHYKLADTNEWNSINEDEGEIAISGFKYGLNYLLVQAESDNGYRYSPDSLAFFYVDFELPPELGKEPICLQGNVFQLKGFPEGGYFSGKGIIGNTNFFNPEIAGPGAHDLVYVYNLEGENIESKTQIVEVLDLFDFSINGPKTVCINSTCSDYNIEGEDLELYEFSWEIQGGQVIQNNQTSVFIEWEDNTPSGKISVTAELMESNCIFTEDIIVHIKENLAPPRSYPVFIDKDLKFLACSDINAKIFRWLKVVDGNEIILGETIKPYFLHEAGAQENEVFFVETAYEEESCFTRSYPCSYGNQWNSSICASLKSNFIDEILDQREEKIEIKVQKEELVISAALNKKYQIDIYDLTGRKVRTSNLLYQETFLRSSFNSGNHIIVVSDKGKIVAKQQVRL